MNTTPRVKARLEVLVPAPGTHTPDDLLAAYMAQAEAVGATLRPGQCRAYVLAGDVVMIRVAIATPAASDFHDVAQALRNLTGYPAADVIVRR